MALIVERGEVTAAEVCQELGLKVSQVRQILSGMVADSLIEAEGANKSRRYRAKKITAHQTDEQLSYRIFLIEEQ